VEVIGIHELIGNALILEGEKKRTMNLRGEEFPWVEEEEAEEAAAEVILEAAEEGVEAAAEEVADEEAAGEAEGEK